MRLSGTIFEPDNGASISVRQVAALRAHSCSLPVRHQSRERERGLQARPSSRIFPILYFIFKGSLVDPRLRASSDHRFIVGALRAQRPCQLSRHLPPSSFVFSLKGGHPCWFRCGRRTRRQIIPSRSLPVLSKGRPGRSSNARVERAPSERARSASRRTARLPRLLLLRARVSGAQDQCECPSIPSSVLRARRAPGRSLSPL